MSKVFRSEPDGSSINSEHSTSPALSIRPGETDGSLFPAEDAFQREAFLERLEGLEEAIPKLLAVFLADAKERIEKLNEALASSDLEQVSHLAHALAGGAGNVDARALHSLARLLEDASSQGDAARSEAIMARVRRSFESVVPLLEREIQIRT